jgi:D-beta-D-heptose 7-phosphate kinase/D-beta-D-heptose 1-phosphate adenosyltransferase
MIVFTNGCFDVLHAGHVMLLKECRRLAGEEGHVIVGLNSDTSASRLKGDSRPINGQLSRKFVLNSLRYVDSVIIFYADTPEELLSTLKPDILVKGGDYTTDQIIGKQYAREVVVFPYVDGFSTTDTIERIAKASSSNR